MAKCKHKHKNKMKPSERPPQSLVPTYLNYTYHLLAYIERIAHAETNETIYYGGRGRKKNGKQTQNEIINSEPYMNWLSSEYSARWARAFIISIGE